MKVKNISKHRYCHAKLDENYKLQMLILKPDEVKDVPDDIAKSWIKTNEVIEFVEPKEARKLADENEALKKELEKLKTPARDVAENKPKTRTQKKQSKTKSKNK